MRSDLLTKYARPVPRYTSYPTAPHFHGDITAEEYHTWLSEIDSRQTASLYVHIPFCKSLCWYCGCSTMVHNRYERIEEYLDLVTREISMVAAVLPGRLRVGHLHFGGGTPTTLAPADFTRFMGVFREQFELAADAEIAVEADPRTLSRDLARALVEGGVTRVSTGVQDFNLDVQRAINRFQSYEMTVETLGWLREVGLDRLNIDLVYGLPSQTVPMLLDTIDKVATLQPSRIAMFGYAHVPWMRRHQTMIDEQTLPDSEVRWEMWQEGVARLRTLGYLSIGLDHFARADDTMADAYQKETLQRNFQGYTTDAADILIGLGASSIGTLPQGYVQNHIGLRDYRAAISAGTLATARGFRLTPDDRLRRAAINALMCHMHADIGALCRAHGQPEDSLDEALATLATFEKDGLVQVAGRCVRVQPPEGQVLVRTLCVAFDRYFGRGTARHSKAV